MLRSSNKGVFSLLKMNNCLLRQDFKTVMKLVMYALLFGVVTELFYIVNIVLFCLKPF